MKFTPLRALFGAVAVLLGIWAGIATHAHRVPRGQSTVWVPAGIAGAADASYESDTAPEPPRIPDQLPQFALHDLLGKTKSISAWKGESLVINFWATWCGPCRREIPLLNALATRWQPSGITFVGIAVDYPEKVRLFAEQFKIGYPLLVGDQDALDVATQFGMASPVFPFTVFADRNGEVVSLFVGELHQPQADLILSVVHQLDENRVDIHQARAQIASGLNVLTPKTS